MRLIPLRPESLAPPRRRANLPR
ncbi:MAG: hypothetical protein QOJ94_2426, partial [Sphingomonadales bacterium]|nr:hypothetical protein [Sphingomonadales bacterium]